MKRKGDHTCSFDPMELWPGKDKDALELRQAPFRLRWSGHVKPCSLDASVNQDCCSTLRRADGQGWRGSQLAPVPFNLSLVPTA